MLTADDNASAVGEGSMAIAFVHKYLQQDARQA